MEDWCNVMRCKPGGSSTVFITVMRFLQVDQKI